MEHYIITKEQKLYDAKDKSAFIEIQHLECDTSGFIEKFGIDISDIEKEVFKANVAAWHHFYKNSSQNYCVIIEEGVDLQVDFDEITSKLSKEAFSWEVFFPYDKIHVTNRNLPISLSRFGFFWGTYCYFINRSSVSKLLEACQKITAPLDEVLLQKGIDKNIRFIYADTAWFRYDQTISNSFLARKESVAEYVKRYRIWQDDEIEQVRDILKYLSTIADETDIKIFLHAGTLLGAIRHGKIMDWDDDVDLMVHSKDITTLIEKIRRDKKFIVTERIWSKTGKTYYKIWKPGGFKVEGYEYTFPFVDIWLVDTDYKIGTAETNDGYIFLYNTFYPLLPTVFENSHFYIPQKSEDVLDGMYKGWREEIKIFSWSHKLKQHAVRQITALIKTDKEGRFIHFK